MRNKNVSKIANTALLIAIQIVLARFLGISTPIVRISFSFIPLSMVAMLYGPVYSTSAAAIADIIGAMLFPIGEYFPGYTITAALTGLTYGLCLYNRKKTWISIGAALVIIGFCWHLGLNSFWLHMTTGKAMMAIMLPRVIKTLVMLPIKLVGIQLAWERICPLVKKLV